MSAADAKVIKLVHSTGIEFDWSPHVRNICLAGQGAACCRYLVGQIGGALHCAKHDPLSRQINARIAAGLPYVARGDNCPGKPYEAVL